MNDPNYMKFPARVVWTLGWCWELTEKGHEGTIGSDGNVLTLNCGGGCRTVYIY